MKAKTIGIWAGIGAGVAVVVYLADRARLWNIQSKALCSSCKDQVTQGRIRDVNMREDPPCLECVEVAEASQVSAINSLTQRWLQETDANKRADLQGQIADYPNQLELLKRRASKADGVSGYFQ